MLGIMIIITVIIVDIVVIVQWLVHLEYLYEYYLPYLKNSSVVQEKKDIHLSKGLEWYLAQNQFYLNIDLQ